MVAAFPPPGGGAGARPAPGTMTVVEHLLELRARLLISLGAVLAGSVAGWFVAPRILQGLSTRVGGKLVFVAPTEGLFSLILVSVAVGVVLAAPVWLAEAWLFVAPGLYAHERRLVRRYLPPSLLLFVAGVAFGYTVVFPLALGFFLGSGEGMRAALDVGQVLGFFLSMTLPFGLVFQLPLVAAVLARGGVIGAGFFRRGRGAFYVSAFTVAAIITPPDAVSQVAMGVPLILLYEVSRLVVAGIERGRVTVTGR